MLANKPKPKNSIKIDMSSSKGSCLMPQFKGLAILVAILPAIYSRGVSAQSHIEHCDSLLKASYGNVPVSKATEEAKRKARFSPKTAEGREKCIDYYNGNKLTRMYLFCKDPKNRC